MPAADARSLGEVLCCAKGGAHLSGGWWQEWDLSELYSGLST